MSKVGHPYERQIEAISTLITEYNLMLANGGTIPFQSKRINYFILVHDG